ncbi:unnamed protein product [Tilletia controversa]|nr:unnamed protein product [Tilletia caries]CAD6917324.1 unnamed protein product [Tilletia controversa]
MRFLDSVSLLALSLAAFVPASFAQYDDGTNLPAKTDAKHDQTGFNDCATRYGPYNQTALCQNVYLRSATEFCLWAPANPNSEIGNEEANVVSWCTMSGFGTRLIPDGTLKGVHFLRTPSFAQVTGHGRFTKMNVRKGDEGGELDPHGATGAGNPVGGLVYTDIFSGGTGKFQRIYEWNQFISATEYSIRACVGPHAKQYCPHIYDLQGSSWNEPANYDDGTFEDCVGTEGHYPGVYTLKNGHTSTWYQEVKPTPPAQPAGSSSMCTQYVTVSNGQGLKRRDQERELIPGQPECRLLSHVLNRPEKVNAFTIGISRLYDTMDKWWGQGAQGERLEIDGMERPAEFFDMEQKAHRLIYELVIKKLLAGTQLVDGAQIWARLQTNAESGEVEAIIDGDMLRDRLVPRLPSLKPGEYSSIPRLEVGRLTYMGMYQTGIWQVDIDWPSNQPRDRPNPKHAVFKSFDFKWAVLVVQDLAEALSHCHRVGVYHCDVAADNVLLTDEPPDGRGVLIDFERLSYYTCKHQSPPPEIQGHWDTSLVEGVLVYEEAPAGQRIDRRNSFLTELATMPEALERIEVFSFGWTAARILHVDLEHTWEEPNKEPRPTYRPSVPAEGNVPEDEDSESDDEDEDERDPAPADVQALVRRCCSYHPQDRPFFDEIVREMGSGSFSFARPAGAAPTDATSASTM